MTTSQEQLTNNQPITVTLASLASAGSRQSASVTNSSNLYNDAAVMLKVKTGASGTLSTGYCSVFAYGSADGGTTFTDNCTGSDASFTPTSPTNLRFLGNINCVANATQYTGGPWSVAAAFGYLPGVWGIVVQNNTGHALDATEGNFTKIFEAQTVQTA